jgi:hypothetical protein
MKMSAMLLLAIIPFLSTVASSSQQATMSTTTAFVTQRTLFSRTITIIWGVARGGQISECAMNLNTILNFTAGHGDRIMGSFTSDLPVNFYVLSDSYAHSLKSTAGGKSNFCYPSGSKDDVLVMNLNMTSLSFDFTINQAGTYQFIFVHFNKSKAVNINFNAGIVG